MKGNLPRLRFAFGGTLGKLVDDSISKDHEMKGAQEGFDLSIVKLSSVVHESYAGAANRALGLSFKAEVKKLICYQQLWKYGFHNSSALR